jgi:hypothetical protein
VPVGSPIIGYVIFLMVSEASCQALWVKCVSVDTAYTSTPIFWKDAYSSARSPSSVGQTKVKVGRVEEDDRPLALQVGVGHGTKLAVVKSGGFERL